MTALVPPLWLHQGRAHLPDYIKDWYSREASFGHPAKPAWQHCFIASVNRLQKMSNQQHLAQKTSSTIFSLLVQRRFYQAKENLIKQVHLIDTCLCHQVTCCMQTSLPQLPFLRRSRPCCRKYSVVSLSTTRLSPFLSSIPSVVLLHATTVFSKLVPWRRHLIHWLALPGTSEIPNHRFTPFISCVTWQSSLWSCLTLKSALMLDCIVVPKFR